MVFASEWTYGQTAARACALAEWLGPAQRVAVLASRSEAAVVATLGACWCGATYIPISLAWPETRILEVLGQIEADALLVDDRGEQRLTPALRAAVPRIVHPLHGLTDRPLFRPASRGADEVAYLLFTSGTTGKPKGVVIGLAAVKHLLQTSQACFSLQASDRLVSNFELSFDGSVFDMFLTWQAGASFSWVPPDQAMAPLPYLRRTRATLTVLAPSTLAFLRGLRALRPGALPALRWSLFGAEALARADAEIWQQVAPNSQVVSLYGPTENTVTSLVQPLQDSEFPEDRDKLALGRPLQGISALVVDEQGQLVAPGERGELALQGPQLAQGYWNDPELTARRFPTLGGQRSYLSGDLAYQDERGVFHHLGRIDHQVKVRGYRVELEEVEAALRRALPGCEAAAAVVGEPGQLIAFLAPDTVDIAQVQSFLQACLPGYARPSRIVPLASLPRTENGKLDRAALRVWELE